MHRRGSIVAIYIDSGFTVIDRALIDLISINHSIMTVIDRALIDLISINHSIMDS
jgi:hypothetical protein